MLRLFQQVPSVFKLGRAPDARAKTTRHQLSQEQPILILFHIYLKQQKQCGNNMVQSFSEKVLRVVSKIPKGKTLSYKEVAKKAGSPGAFRAVGSVLKKNF